MRYRILAFAIIALCPAAHARDGDGRLHTILSPSDTQPAIVSRGGELDVVLRENAELRLESAAGSFRLDGSAPRTLRGLQHLRATLPAALPAGAYSLVASTETGQDRNFRAVFVLDAPLVEYRVAVWSNPRVSANPDAPDTPLFRVTAEINAGRPALVLVTGDLTAAGSPEQFRLALELLNDCSAPTLVAPGPTDLEAGHAPEFLGEYPAAVPFGPDAYLLCPAARTDLGESAGRLHFERRRIRAARWSIGAGWNFDAEDLRAELTVFVDDPLDAILGTTGTFPGSTSPWGPTRLFAAPNARSALEWFTAGPRPIAPDSAATAP